MMVMMTMMMKIGQYSRM